MKTARRILVGSDVLEIMSIAMYAEPLVVYRELVQNSADGIECAIRSGDLASTGGEIRISFEEQSRSVSVIDNGFGLSNDEFEQQMMALGASGKRANTYRGFRGIGRLAGLGHCRNLVFKSRSKGDRYVSEARWDGAKIRGSIIRDEIVPLEELTREALAITRNLATDEPEHFFEARLEGVRRLPDDRLFDPTMVGRYLSQVAPVAFLPTFSWADFIVSELQRRTSLLQVNLLVEGVPVFKPYTDAIEVKKGRFARIKDVQFVEVPSSDRNVAAFGWIAHTEYLGAFGSLFDGRGLRVRSGNLQVGDETMLARAFPEERFNLWALGEFHVFDAKLRPNARRDAFEPGVAVDDLFNQLAPYGASIAKRCRQESKSRNAGRRLESLDAEITALDESLYRNTTALADAIRGLAEVRLTQELTVLTEARPNADESLAKRLAESKARATKALRRRKPGTRLSSREQGRLDILSWLYGSGNGKLVGPAMTALKSPVASRKK